MRKAAHCLIKLNLIFGIIATVISAISIFVMFIGAIYLLCSNEVEETVSFVSLTSLIFAIVAMFYALGTCIASIIVSKLTLKSMDENRMHIAYGVLSIVFGSVPVGGILYIVTTCMQNCQINSNYN